MQWLPLQAVGPPCMHTAASGHQVGAHATRPQTSAHWAHVVRRQTQDIFHETRYLFYLMDFTTLIQLLYTEVDQLPVYGLKRIRC
jgi:hypothetical protein